MTDWEADELQLKGQFHGQRGCSRHQLENGDPLDQQWAQHNISSLLMGSKIRQTTKFCNVVRDSYLYPWFHKCISKLKEKKMVNQIWEKITTSTGKCRSLTSQAYWMGDQGKRWHYQNKAVYHKSQPWKKKWKCTFFLEKILVIERNKIQKSLWFVFLSFSYLMIMSKNIINSSEGG